MNTCNFTSVYFHIVLTSHLEVNGPIVVGVVFGEDLVHKHVGFGNGEH